MPIATAYETHREAVFPGGVENSYVSAMPCRGRNEGDNVMSKWIAVPATILAVIATGLVVCFKVFTASHAAEPGVFQGAGSHKASGHVEIVRDGA